MIRSAYSFRTAVGTVEEVASRLQETGDWPAFPIADRTSTFGFVRWRDEVQKAGGRPVYGVELAVSPSYGEKQPAIDWWTFLAEETLAPLHDLIRTATEQPNAALSYEQAIDARGVIKVAGPNVRVDLIPDDVPVALCPGIPRGQVNAVRERRLRWVARPNNVFPREADRELYRVALARTASVQTYPQWITSDEEWATALCRLATDEELSDAIELRNGLLARSVAQLRQARVLSPERPATLREMCVRGAKRLGIDLRRRVYRERLDRELALIAEKKFEDYFYIIADLMAWAKERMAVGPARGSSCGSLVCYLLDITAIDPIPHDLLFERFIDVTRADLPDIDLDFSDVRREMVLNYVRDKYGADHVARLGSVMMFRPKSILARIGVALRIPSWEIDELSNTIVKRMGGDSRASQTILDAFDATDVGRKIITEYPEAAIASRMEGTPNAAGQHAAGVVVTEDRVVDVVAVDGRTGATMCDKRDAEKLGLLKIDMLGLTQLGVFERCLELIGVEEEITRYLEKIPMDDPAAIDILNQRKFCGVFQFVPGSASANLVTELVVSRGGRMESFRDIVDMTAIVRPGPLGSGQTDRWLARRSGMEEATYFHPLVEPYVRDTLGVIIYQEQVMQIGRGVGDLTWDDVTALRKTMSKSLGKEYFDKWGDRWKAGAARKGMDPASCEKMWNDLCQFGMWAFNKSHSVAYATVSYWCLWLKAHYPLEFAAATLDAEGDALAQVTILRELREEGVDYVPVDPERSTDRWQVADGRLIGPLTAIRGIGPKKVQQIMDHRRAPEASRKPLPASILKMLREARTEIDSLTPVADAIRRNVPDPSRLGIVSRPVPIADAVPGRFSGPVMVMGVIKRIDPLNENDASRVAKRGGQLITDGPLEAINFFLRDDHGADIFCKIGRWDFPKIGRQMLENTRVGKSLYAVKGEIPRHFRMIKVKAIKYLGDMDDDEAQGRRDGGLDGRGYPGGAQAPDGRGPDRESDSGEDGDDAERGHRGVAPEAGPQARGEPPDGSAEVEEPGADRRGPSTVSEDVPGEEARRSRGRRPRGSGGGAAARRPSA